MNAAEIEAEKQYNAQEDREARSQHLYMVYLKDHDDPYAEWFESEICGTHHHCYSTIRSMSLDMHFKTQIVEA